ncbi:MAG: hypothetical protein WC453_00030 [Patescibacteria group bacterium]
MSANRQSLFSLLSVIALLVLVAIATVLYSGDQEERAQREQNLFWRQVFAAWEAAKPVLRGAVDFALGQQSGETIAAPVVAVVTPSPGSAATAGFWSGLFEKIKAEWRASGNPALEADVSGGLESTVPGLLRWEKTADGAALILQTKHGSKQILSLPFKFLGR